jgi:hypothetical protein
MAKTTEVSRLTMHHLHDHPATLHASDSWVRELLYRGGLQTDRKHWKQRLDAYLNKPTKDGRSVEVQTREYPVLRHMGSWLASDKPPLTVVEVGFNRFNKICKVAVVIQLDVSRRWLFLCVGIDGGIKTFYITDHFKIPRT